jgi:hypothetical protein
MRAPVIFTSTRGALIHAPGRAPCDGVLARRRTHHLGHLGCAGLFAILMGCAAAAAADAVVPPELLAKARAGATVRVIAHLRVAPDADPARIEAVKRAAIAEIAGTRHRVVRELPGLPSFALEASEETLRLLSASSHVLRVQEDVPEHPNGD